MSIIKSFAVGNGDMFYIDHDSDNFTIIDCCLTDDNKERIINELYRLAKGKGMRRFISTHPDEDHLRGITYLDKNLPINNFYCVENNATKDDESHDFIHYKKLRDSEKTFFMHKNCSRKWLNTGDRDRRSSELHVHWPDVENVYYMLKLIAAGDGESPNNISPIIEYKESAVNFLWMGDLETDFLENIEDDIEFPKVTVLFAPHHGRDSGKIPQSILKKLDPKIIVIGEAPSEHLNYYQGYNTITQNSADNITFHCEDSDVHVYVSNDTYTVDFLSNYGKKNHIAHGKYIGSLSRWF
ncbi:MAG: hypothetical protein JSR51_11380 [Proteobacteria bacterium]|nr:hypothetical protein [Pseudomonadota bacterium]